MMGMVEELAEQLPGLDCGSCGAPTCRALAEDIVRGEASRNDCIYVFFEYIGNLSREISYTARNLNSSNEEIQTSVEELDEYVDKLDAELKRKDV